MNRSEAGRYIRKVTSGPALLAWIAQHGGQEALMRYATGTQEEREQLIEELKKLPPQSNH